MRVGPSRVVNTRGCAIEDSLKNKPYYDKRTIDWACAYSKVTQSKTVFCSKVGRYLHVKHRNLGYKSVDSNCGTKSKRQPTHSAETSASNLCLCEINDSEKHKRRIA